MESVEAFLIQDKSLAPEERLWVAVIEQTFWDAAQIALRFNCVKNSPIALKERNALLRDIYSPWFEEVCQFASLDVDFARNKLNDMLNPRI
jgi:hypothetical protein